jgi:membrane protease YdiL (CAAX protease family)
VVLLLPLIQAGLALLISAMLPSGLGTYAPALTLAALPGFFIYMLIFTGLAEEPGWRGFALPRLQKRFNAEKSSLILGVIWAAWHYPFLVYLNASAGFFPLVSLLAGYTIATVGWTIVNTWVYNSTRSVLLVILLHAISNTVSAYLIAGFSSSTSLSLVFALLPWALAVMLSRRLKPENLSRQKRHML